jgi:potassium-dependent mechanosensitive channel
MYDVWIRALLVGLLLTWPPVSLWAQSPGTAGQAAAPPGAAQVTSPAAWPGAFEVATRWRQVADSAAAAERSIAQLAAADGIRNDLEEARTRQAELQALLAAMIEVDYVRQERVSRLRDQVLLEDQRLVALRDRTLERVDQLGDLRSGWVERQRFWRSWRQALRGDPEYPAVAPDMASAIARTDSVTAAASTALTALLSLQRTIAELRQENEQVRAAIAAMRVGGRAMLLQRAEPVLFSREHRTQLAEGGWRAWNPLAKLRLQAHVVFLREHLTLLVMQLLLIVLIALTARRLRAVGKRTDGKRTDGKRTDGWSGVLDYPWALGAFVSAVFLLQRVMLAPPLWDVFVWTILGATAALLSRRLFDVLSLRLTVYLFAAFYPLFLALEVAQLPAPVFRTGLAAVAALALPVFVLLARQRAAAAAAARSRDPRRILPLRVGAVMWAVVLVTVTLGYDALGRWVLHASVTSGAVVFIAVVVLAVVRGGLGALIQLDPAAERGRFVRRVAVRLAQRLMLVVQIVTVIVAVLVLLDVWQIAESPVATWQRLISLGFMVGPVRVTLGRILIGAAVVYLASLISWLIRSFVQSEAYRRWDFDRGVGDSISALVHYTLITIGFVIFLAVLGVELQNFAIIIGALGIGIGFGLQNVVNNFVSGLILLFERPVRVGDTVVVDGEWGTIRKIGLRSTIMLTFDQSEMIVPNADLVSEKVTNWTLSSPNARVIMAVGVAYGSSIADVLEILRAAAHAHDAVLTEPPPQTLFVGFGDSSLDFELRVWVENIRLRLEVRSVVLTEVERRLAEAGIEIPFPQRDLHVRSIDAAAAAAMRARSEPVE